MSRKDYILEMAFSKKCSYTFPRDYQPTAAPVSKGSDIRAAEPINTDISKLWSRVLSLDDFRVLDGNEYENSLSFVESYDLKNIRAKLLQETNTTHNDNTKNKSEENKWNLTTSMCYGDKSDEGNISSEIEIQPRICITQGEIAQGIRRDRFFSQIYKREGVESTTSEGLSTEESSNETVKHKENNYYFSKNRDSRPRKKKNTLGYNYYRDDESENEDFSPTTDSYKPSSQSDSEKEIGGNNQLMQTNATTKKKKVLRKKIEAPKGKQKRRQNIHRQLSLNLDSCDLQDIGIDLSKSVLSYDSDLFNNPMAYENNSHEICNSIFETDNNNLITDTNKINDENHQYKSQEEIIRSNVNDANQQNKSFDEMSNVLVAKCQNEGGIRKWDKKNACLFCSRLYSKLPRHLEKKHSAEIEIAKLLSFPTGSEERKNILDEVRKKGNYLHNTNVLKLGSGVIIPQRRCKSTTSADSLLPCPSCFAFYSKKKLSRHYNNCENRDNIKAKKVQKEGSMLLPIADGASEKLRTNVLSRMNIDEITLVVKQDPLILKLGSQFITKHDQDSHLNNYISQKMREIARFLIEIRKIEPAIKTLTECINPVFFPKIIDAVRIVSSYNPKTGKYGTPSLALKIGHSLKKCAGIIITDSLIKNIPSKREIAQNFMTLCENEWSTNISSGALTTTYRNKWNMPDRMPLAEDIKTLNNYLRAERDKYITLIKNAEVTLHNWTSLAKIVLAQTLLFNRRRAGEVERIPVEAYNKKATGQNLDKNICETLTEFEQAISQSFVRFEVRGKKGRKVPIILYPNLIEAYDMLMLYRYHVGIPVENNHFFALAPLSHLRGSKILRTFAADCGAKQPEALTSTKLRKNVATMSQLLNLSNHELDQLATFMGHDIRVHREYYRLPESTIQLAKISKILIASEKGNLHKFKGKNLDEFDIDINKISDYDESEESQSDDNFGSIDINVSQETSIIEPEHGNKNVKTTKKKSTILQEISIPENDGQNDKKGNKKPKKKNPTKKKAVSKKKLWTSEEKRVVEDYFSRDIIRQKVPGKADCEDCLDNNLKVLEDRDWKGIKYYVYNIIQRDKKKY